MASISSVNTFISAHRTLTAIGIAAACAASWYAYATLNAPSAETRYITVDAATATIITTVTGTGQMSDSNQFDVKPQASGTITALSVTQGQSVKSGQLIAQLDARSAQKSVRDALANLESAQLSLQKLKQPADALSVTKAQNELTSAQQNKADAEQDLVKAYDDGYNAVAQAFLDLPEVVSGLESVLSGKEVALGQKNIDAYYDLIRGLSEKSSQFLFDANTAYATARAAYLDNLDAYKASSRYSSHEEIETLLAQSYATSKLVADAIKNAKNFLDLVNDSLTNGGTGSGRSVPSVLTTHRANVQSYTGTTNSIISSLLSSSNAIENYASSIVSAERSIAEKTQSLAQLQAGTDALDLASQELALRQRKNALQDAYDALADYSVRAPFDGVIASVGVKKGEQASSGTAVVTMVAGSQIAEISLNEVDVAKVAVGQKATLTFDALPELTISGAVAGIDTVGAVSQGVVSYAVRISLDVQDERIKPGMSVSASIATAVRQDVLAVPSAAIQVRNGQSTVRVFDTIPENADTQNGFASAQEPRSAIIETGLSNDTMTEVLSGIDAGAHIVTRTVEAAKTAATQSTAPSILNAAGVRTGTPTGGSFTGGGQSFRR